MPFTPALRRLVPALLLLTACEDPGPKFTTVYIGPHGSEGTLDEANRAQGGIPVHVEGTALTEGPDPLSARVAAMLAQGTNRPDWIFRPAGPPPAAADGIRVVLSLDPARGFTGVTLCQGERIAVDGMADSGATAEATDNAPPLTFRLVLCEDDRRVAEILATLPRVESATAESFTTLLRQSAGALVEREQQHRK